MLKLITAMRGAREVSLDEVSAASRPFAAVAKIAAVALLALNVLSWLIPSWSDVAARGWSALGSAPIALTSDALAFSIAVSTGHLLVLAYALFAASALFQRFAQRDFFTPAVGALLQRMGVALAAFGLLAPIARAALTVILTMHNPPGQRMLTIGVSANDVVIVIFGALIIMIGWVMAEAARLADENRSFV